MKLLSAGLICLLLAVPCAARTITVDDDGLADFNKIQAAIDDANEGDVIIVKPGTYTGDGNADIDFKGRAIAVRSTDPNDADIVANTIIDCNGTEQEPHRGFYFHSAEDPNSVLRGLTIINGYAPDEPVSPQIPASRMIGGAILCKDSSPTISNCVISGNSAAWGEGGGIFCKRSSPRIVNCAIAGNLAYNGAGICCEAGTMGGPTITNCTFIGNRADADGGAIWCTGVVTINRCAFSRNSVAGRGGGIYNSGNLTLINCTLKGNSADSKGGGVYSRLDSSAMINCTVVGNSAGSGGGLCSSRGYVVLTNCTFAANSATHGSALACNSYEQKYPSHLKLANSILWDRTDKISNTDNSIIEITFSNIQGGWPGVGNIDVDPCFADPNSGDYLLKSQAGRWDPASQSWVQDDVTSPCIDAGDPMSPIGREPFPNGGIINMGAYGSTAEASKSYFGEPVCKTIVAGDINGDCKVDWADFKLLALHWLQENQ